MSHMFCHAHAFTFLELLRISWPLAPADCGESKRQLTSLQVADCLASVAASPSSSPSLKPASSFDSSLWATLCLVGGMVVIAPLLAFFLARRWKCKFHTCVLRQPGHAVDIELAQPLLTTYQCSSLPTVEIGEYVRASCSEEALRSSCCSAKLPVDGRLRCKGEVGLVLALDECDDQAW
eukprot:1047945-Amphidinium_carterae.1